MGGTMIIKVRFLNDDNLYNNQAKKCLDVGDIYDADIGHINPTKLSSENRMTNG
jgi:hypothetical protein